MTQPARPTHERRSHWCIAAPGRAEQPGILIGADARGGTSASPGASLDPSWTTNKDNERNQLRIKRFAPAIVAVAALAVPAAASANVAVTDGVGHVDKGDVQTALKWNNGDFDKGVGSLKFAVTGTWTNTNETRWQCGDGVQSRTSTVVDAITGTPTVTTLKSSNGKQITGWDLSNITAGNFTVVSGGYSGAPYVGYCPNGDFSGFLPNVFTNTYDYSGGLTVNGVALPNTPAL